MKQFNTDTASSQAYNSTPRHKFQEQDSNTVKIAEELASSGESDAADQ
jgi:hypothetical protein